VDNTGLGGTTISGSSVGISNGVGALIAAPTGGTAIKATYSLGLTNAGTINGNIDAGAAYGGSVIDSTAGTINGNVILGSGNDTLNATYSNGSLVTGITGSIDGGGGINTLKVTFGSNAALSSALPMPTRFSQFYASVSKGATLTLDNGFTASGMITLDGAGMVVNNASLTGTTQSSRATEARST
jgi:hypothetical protein